MNDQNIENKAEIFIFDLDGTLIDSSKKLYDDVIGTFARLNHKISQEQILGDWYELAEQYGIDKNKFDKAFDKRKSWRQSLRNKEVKIFPETHRTLEALSKKNYIIGLLSRSTEEYTNLKLDYFDLTKYFKKIKVCNPAESFKKREAIELIREIGPQKILIIYFVGDKEGLDMTEVINRYAGNKLI